MYHLGIIYSLYISLNLVLTLIFKNPHLVLGRMCLPSPIVINPNPNPPNSTSAVYSNHQEPQMGKWAYSSHELKALDNTKQSTGDKPKTKTSTIQSHCHNKNTKNKLKANKNKA